METPITTLKIVTILCILVTMLCIRAFIECTIVLNWYKRKYQSTPRIGCSPKINRFHKFLNAILFLPKL